MGTGLVERWGTDRTGKKAIEHGDPPKDRDKIGAWNNMLEFEWIDLGTGVPEDDASA